MRDLIRLIVDRFQPLDLVVILVSQVPPNWISDFLTPPLCDYDWAVLLVEISDRFKPGLAQVKIVMFSV